MSTDGTTKSTGRTILKNALFIVLVGATAFVGVKLGMGSRETMNETASEFDQPPESNLKPGVPFPAVDLIDEDGAAANSQSLIAGTGGVVMFMDLSCPPCQEMTKKLQQAYADGLADIPVIGITPEIPHNVTMYRHKNGVTFPIYSDTSYVFMSMHRVQNFPLLVIIGRNGTVRDFTFDARLPIDPERIHELISE